MQTLLAARVLSYLLIYTTCPSPLPAAPYHKGVGWSCPHACDTPALSIINYLKTLSLLSLLQAKAICSPSVLCTIDKLNLECLDEDPNGNVSIKF